MVRPPAKLPFVLLALGLWILACPASWAEDNDANALNQQVKQLIEQGKYQEAIPIAERALEVAKLARGSEHPETAAALNNLGLLFLTMGEYAKAEPLLQEALRIYRKVLRPEHPDTAKSLNSLGQLYDDMGEYAKAEPLYQEALRIYRKVLGPEHPDTATSLNNLAALEFDLGRIDEATALARQASAAQLAILSKIFSFTSEEQRLAYLGVFYPYSLFPILKGTETDLAAAVLRYKGVVLDSIVEDRLLAEASQGAEVQKLVEQLNLDKSQLGQLLLQPAQRLSDKTNQRIEALEGEVEKIEGQLAQHVAGLGHARHALGVSLEQVQPTIPNDGALIEYLRYSHWLGKGKSERRYGAIVLFSKGAPLWIPLGKAKDSIFMVGSFRALLTSAYGHILVSKLILFFAMVGFGAWNLFLLKPRIAVELPTVNLAQNSAVHLLLRNVLWEIGLGTLVILIVGLLGITPPPMR